MKKIWILLILFIIILGIFGYTQSGAIKSQFLKTSKIIPTVNATPTLVNMSNWKTFTYSDGTFTIKYPPDWSVTQGLSNGGGYGVEIQSPDYHVGIGITENTVFTEDCNSSVKTPLNINEETLYGCYSQNPNGSVSWASFVKVLSPTRKFGISAVAGSEVKDKNIIPQILSTLTFR